MTRQRKLTREEIAAPIDGEVEALENHEKEKWFTFFTKDALIEDPVGTGPFAGKGLNDQGPIRRFYESLIVPTQFTYVSKWEIIVGMDVVRDVELTITLSTGITVVIDVHALYKIVIEDGEPKIAHLLANYRFDSIEKKILKAGLLKGIWASMLTSRRIIRICGLKDYLIYLKDTRTGISRKGIEAVEEFVTAVNRRDRDGLAALFYGVEKCIQFPAGSKYYSSREFLDVIANDDSLSVLEITPSSWTTSCIFEFSNKKSSKKGIAFFGFNPRCKKIESIRFYWET